MLPSNKPKPSLYIKNVHNWLGLASALFLLALLVTGIALNHPGALIPGSQAERLALAADPSDPRTLYRGTASALERSTDGGATWEEVPMLFPASEVVDIAFHPRDARVVAVLQRWQGPLLSADGGAVWEPVALDFDPQATGIELVSLAISGDGALWLETSAGLLRASRPVSSPGERAAWEPVDFDPARKNWLRIVRTFHNGHFFGPWFVKLYDASAVALLLLILTGVVLCRVKSS
jgi:uncharacterized iron-regulated membrane protein